jgi:hypothetical protein
MYKLFTLLSLTALCGIGSLFAVLTVHTVTEHGIHFKETDKGGTYTKPLPDRVSIPEDATGITWEEGSFTLSWLEPQPVDAEGAAVDPVAASVTLTQTEIDTAAAYTEPAPVPERVTRRQLYLALYAAGIDLDVAVQNIQDATARREAEISVQTALYFPRTHDLVNSLAGQLGLTVAEVDDIYRAAAQITDQE